MIPDVAGGDQELRVWDTPIVTMLNLAVFWVAAASAAVGGVSWLLTFTPWTAFITSGYSLPFFFLTFPLVGWAVFVQLGRPERNRRGADLLKEFPRRWRVPYIVLFVVVWAASLATMFALPGQPEYEPKLRRYAYDDHGVLIPATRAGYLHAVVVQNRLFLGIPMVFTLAVVAITWHERNRRRGLLTPDRWLRPVRPRPKIPLPAAALALAAAAAVAGSIACVATIVGRVDAYNGGAIYLRTGHPVRATLAAENYVVFVGCTDGGTCPPMPPGTLSASVVSGATLVARPDPSSDHLSEAAQPFTGELSFTVPAKEVVNLNLSARLGQPAFVVPSPGEEAHALIGWIILAGAFLLVLLAGLIQLARLLRWRGGFGVRAVA